MVKIVSLDIMGAVGTAADTFIYLLIGILVMGIIGIIVYVMSHNVKVTVRDIVDKNKFIIYDRGRFSKDAKGNRWFKLMRLRRKEPMPPSMAVMIGKKGKKHVEFYRTEDDVLIPIIDNFDYVFYKSINQDKIKKYLEATEKYKHRIEPAEDIYSPFTTNQRSLLINELKESEKYRKTSGLQLLSAAAPYIAIVLILALFLIFWGDAIEPINDIGSRVIDAQKQVNEKFAQLSLIEKLPAGSEILTGETGENETATPPN